MSLKDRIREAMGKMSPAELARAAKVTPASATFWLDGKTKSLRAEKAALLEAATGYRATWIVTGKGPKRVEDEPGGVFHALTQDEKRILEDLRVLLDEDRERFAKDIAEKATQMRAYAAKIMQRITPAPSPHGTDPGKSR